MAASAQKRLVDELEDCLPVQRKAILEAKRADYGEGFIQVLDKQFGVVLDPPAETQE